MKNADVLFSPTHYRPISLLSIISKLVGTIINKKVIEHLGKNKLINHEQYGFRSALSTTDYYHLKKQ